MSSTSSLAPAPIGGRPLSAPTARAVPSVSFTLEEREFARRVRTPWWQSAAPLAFTLLFGAALVFVAAASPPTETIRRMTSAEGQRGAGAAFIAAERADADYHLPAQWQWPRLDASPALDDRLACDPAGLQSAC